MMESSSSRVMTALASGPLTVKEISERTGIPVTTVYNNIRMLREGLLIEKQKTLYALTFKGRKYLEIVNSTSHNSCNKRDTGGK